MSPPPFVAVGLAHHSWTEIGASDWLVCQLRFGLQLPWKRKPPKSGRIPSYNLSPGDLGFACGEVLRWMNAGYCHRASPRDSLEIRQRGRVSPAFVTTAARKSRLVIDYTVVNESLEDSTFRMDQLSDLAPSRRRDDCLFKADIQDAYYHLRLRKEDQIYLYFSVDGVLHVPACLNCGLAVAVVLYQGDAPGRLLPQGARPPSILLLGRLLRGRSNCAERSSGDRVGYTQIGARLTRAVQSARSHAAPHEKPFRRLARAGDPWDSC
jgi:hypothetical protein